jgi:hypothetical protein
MNGKTFSRVVLPIAAFIVLVGSIAWVAQNLNTISNQPDVPVLPDKGKGGSKDQQATLPKQKFVTFLREKYRHENMPAHIRNHAVFDVPGFLLPETLVNRDDPKSPPPPPPYIAEYEYNDRAHYDFPVENISGGDLLIALDKTECDCSELLFAPVSSEIWSEYSDRLAKRRYDPLDVKHEFTWEKFVDTARDKQQPHAAIRMPANSKGVIRTGWHVRKSVGVDLNLHWKISFRKVDGDQYDRQIEDFWVPAKVVRGVNFEIPSLELGTLSPGSNFSHVFKAWSATRASGKLELKPQIDDGLCIAEVTPITDPGAIKRTQDVMLSIGKTYSRVLALWEVRVTVRESAPGKQLDLGLVERPFTIFLDGKPQGPHDSPVPFLVKCHVQGDVDVGPPNANGRINLGNFLRRNGKDMSVRILAKNDCELSLLENYPSFLKVELRRDENAKVAVGKKSWHLDVKVLEDRVSGTIDNCVIELRTSGANSRLIRVPVIGTATN